MSSTIDTDSIETSEIIPSVILDHDNVAEILPQIIPGGCLETGDALDQQLFLSADHPSHTHSIKEIRRDTDTSSPSIPPSTSNSKLNLESEITDNKNLVNGVVLETGIMASKKVERAISPRFGITPSSSEDDSGSLSGEKFGKTPLIIPEPVEISLDYFLPKHEKHIFIFSDAGKPIYTRWGNEEDLAAFFGLIQAFVTIMSDYRKHDLYHFAFNGSWKAVFLVRTPLVFCITSRLCVDTVKSLHRQLDLLYHQILCILTRAQLEKIFETKKNYDLRRLIAGTEKTLNSLVILSDHDPSLMLDAVRCLPMINNLRDQIAQSIASSANSLKIKDLVFAIVVARHHLIAMVRMKKYTLHPCDLHLLINLIHCNPSFRIAESWTPICLPRFDDSGFLYTHISFLSENCPACLLLVSVDKNAFFSLSSLRKMFLEKLVKVKALDALTEAVNNVKGIKLSELPIADLWHFLFKNRTSSQLSCPHFEKPYITESERRRLIYRYRLMINQVHRKSVEETAANSKVSLKILYDTGPKESILAWITSNFELYAAFSPLVSRHAAIQSVDKLMKWLKKEEDKYFVLSTPTF